MPSMNRTQNDVLGPGDTSSQTSSPSISLTVVASNISAKPIMREFDNHSATASPITALT